MEPKNADVAHQRGLIYYSLERHQEALDDFDELEKALNRPLSWIAEVVCFFPDSDVDLAFRMERSRELEDEPETRYGVALTWYMHKHIILTMEYLHGQFDTDTFAMEKEDLRKGYEKQKMRKSNMTHMLKLEKNMRYNELIIKKMIGKFNADKKSLQPAKKGSQQGWGYFG